METAHSVAGTTRASVNERATGAERGGVAPSERRCRGVRGAKPLGVTKDRNPPRRTHVAHACLRPDARPPGDEAPPVESSLKWSWGVHRILIAGCACKMPIGCGRTRKSASRVPATADVPQSVL